MGITAADLAICPVAKDFRQRENLTGVRNWWRSSLIRSYALPVPDVSVVKQFAQVLELLASRSADRLIARGE
jgi:hypothetical protein